MLRSKLLTLLIVMAAISCHHYKHDYVKRGKFRPNKKAQYFLDYDIYNGVGVNPISIDSLTYPFFEVFYPNDSTVRLSRVTENFQYLYQLPLDDRIFHRSYDIKDGTTDHFFRIYDDRIVKFGYYGNIYEAQNWSRGFDSIFLFNLIPSEVEIQIGDTLYRMTSPDHCWGIETFHEDVEINIAKSDIEDHWVLPFELDPDMHCEHVEKWYYNEQGQLMRTHSDGQTQVWNSQPVHQFAYWNPLIFRY